MSPTANIILNGKKLKAFPHRYGTRQRCSLLPHTFNTVSEVLSRGIKTEKEMKDIRIRKEEVRISTFAGNVMLYRGKPKHGTEPAFRTDKQDL